MLQTVSPDFRFLTSRQAPAIEHGNLGRRIAQDGISATRVLGKARCNGRVFVCLFCFVFGVFNMVVLSFSLTLVAKPRAFPTSKQGGLECMIIFAQHQFLGLQIG